MNETNQKFRIYLKKKKRMKKINVEKDEGPGIEIGGEVNEGLEAQLLEEIGVVNGERVG